MWQDLWVAMSLMLVMEGILPFLAPQRLREGLRQIAELDDRSLRLIGFISMLLGVVTLYLVH